MSCTAAKFTCTFLNTPKYFSKAIHQTSLKPSSTTRETSQFPKFAQTSIKLLEIFPTSFLSRIIPLALLSQIFNLLSRFQKPSPKIYFSNSTLSYPKFIQNSPHIDLANELTGRELIRRSIESSYSKPSFQKDKASRPFSFSLSFFGKN